ncbi:MAG: hypothetical protein K0S06_2661 [Microvirga sp.]|jgi:hypothetical protein|nr:hypothetical protein [Microvirga sp.]
MPFQAQFVKFRAGDNRPVPVGLPVQIVATCADDALNKLKRLAAGGRWPAFADAVRLFEGCVEIDSFIPAADEPQRA